MILLVAMLTTLEVFAYQEMITGKLSLFDLFFLSLSIVTIVILLTMHAVNYFTVPIRELGVATKNMSKGNFTDVFKTNAKKKSNLISEMIQNLQIAVKRQVQTLNKEIEEKKIAEEKLNDYKMSLEEQVKERTQTLHNTNIELKKEIQKREETEKEKELITHQAFQASKFAILGEMARDIAHEINNPLAIIKGKSQQMSVKQQRGNLKDSDIKNGLEKINHTVDRIIKIIRGLKTLSRDDINDPIKIDHISTIIDKALSICTEKFKNEGISIKLISHGQDLITECRSNQIAQVIINLLNNAFNSISQNCRYDDNEQRWVLIEVRDHGEEISLSIANGGPLVTESQKGLSLSIATSIIEHHKGNIKLDTSDGHTKFIITLKKELNENQPQKKTA